MSLLNELSLHRYCTFHFGFQWSEYINFALRKRQFDTVVDTRDNGLVVNTLAFDAMNPGLSPR